MERYQQSRQQNIQTLKDRGLEILSEWTGQRVLDRNNKQLPVTVRNTICGHTFTSSATNLLSRDIHCSVCGKLERTGNINHWSERNSDRWRQTASAWKIYRSDVQKHTRVTYRQNATVINPDNLPFGRAGTPGAHHLDHIVPVRWCFEHQVPPRIVADVSNLQIIPWLDNVAKRDHLVDVVPLLFQPWIPITCLTT